MRTRVGCSITSTARCAPALSGLFEGLLDISRLDAGVVEVHRVSFAIQPLIERVCNDYRAKAREKGIELRSRPTRATVFTVFTDPMLLERILRNIVLNAVTYEVLREAISRLTRPAEN